MIPKFVTITAENTWTEPVSLLRGTFNISVQGDFTAKVTVQRSFNKGKSWEDVPPKITQPLETFGTNGEDYVFYRIGVKTGEYLSGTIKVRIG